jgi:hypothetical protein
MNFKEWLIKEGGKGSGPKISATGLRAGGNASVSSMIKVVRPHFKIKKVF